MQYQELIVLLPCHSLEDFPTYHEGDDANSLLACWSALWHPALMAAARQAPTWRRVDEAPGEARFRLFVVPSVCAQRLPTGFAQRVKDEGGLLIRKTSSREEILAAALPPLGESPPGEQASSTVAPAAVDPELAADFLALGYCYLQIELLTRQMRYASNLDETYFKATAVAAAEAAVEGNVETAHEKLAACFNLLAEERDHYYPVDAFLLDFVLTAKTTLGEELRAELSRETPTNVFISGELVAELAARQPATLAALKDGLAAGRIGVIGGEASEERLPLLAHESILAELQSGLAVYEEHLGSRPTVFGRWRYGLTPHLPGILHKLGFRGAVHTGFEEGRTPEGVQFKVRWEGLDGSAIDAIAKSPLDASKPQTFLSLATRLGESMDSDHVATLGLAHWPAQASPWMDDLRRIARYCSALGKWVTVDHYFENTDQPGQLERFEPDRYRSAYLKQAIIRKQENPIGGPVEYWQSEAAGAAAESMRTLAAMVTGKKSECKIQNAEFDETARELASALTSARPNAPRGTLVINPCSFVRRMGVEGLEISGLPAIERPVYAADEHLGIKQAVVDVPAFGFVHLTPGNSASGDSRTPLLADEGVLRNEFFEAVINPTTGSLAAIRDYKSRTNRLSQQLALRGTAAKQKPGDTHRDGDDAAVYTVMAADSMETTIATRTLGEIVTRGRLLTQTGTPVATFMQTYRVWRGSRVLQVEIELNPTEEPRADPWNSYYCCRFAWSSDLMDLYRSVNETRHRTEEKRFESPHFIELSDEKIGTTILTGGLAFHRRHEDRMLDTLLISRGETRRHFRLGIGIDLAYPLHEAIGLLTPRAVLHDVTQPPSGTSGWLVHLSSRNVVATSVRPLTEGGRVTGIAMRLLEIAGRPANLTISTFRPLKTAETVDFLGSPLASPPIEEGKARLDLAAGEWTEVHVRW
jgi:alpha-mannosidase